MSTANPAVRRKFCVVGGVVLMHAAGLWALQGGLARRPADAVVALQMVGVRSTAIAPSPQPPAPVRTLPAKVAAPQTAAKELSTASVRVRQAPPLAEPPLSVAPALPATVAPGGGANGVPQPAATAAHAVGVAGGGAIAAAAQVDLPSSDADYLHNPKPEYPRLSRQRNEQGKVVVNVLIGIDGTAQKAEIKLSSGFERLDQAALATVKAWRYVPGKRGGMAEAMWFAVPISFVMD